MIARVLAHMSALIGPITIVGLLLRDSLIGRGVLFTFAGIFCAMEGPKLATRTRRHGNGVIVI